jgi:hypothetical protein
MSATIIYCIGLYLIALAVILLAGPAYGLLVAGGGTLFLAFVRVLEL